MKYSRSVPVFIIALFFLTALPAYAKRVALVVGIDRYQNVTSLKKAVNDARVISETLNDLGFSVIEVHNPGRRSMNLKLAEFTNQIDAGDEALFFFSGHGIQTDSGNYLLPADIPKGRAGEEFVKSESVAVRKIMRMITKARARVSILILDACRNNPFAGKYGKSIGTARGLGRTEAPEGSFIMYSAGEGQVALDRLNNHDPNPNSVFTRILAPMLKQPGLKITDMARKLRRKVQKIARRVGHKQRPAYYDEVTGDFYFRKGTGRIPPGTVVRMDPDEQLWKRIAGSNNDSDFKFYLRQFPQGKYAAVARLMLREMAEKKVVSLSGGQEPQQPTSRKFPNEPLPIDINVDPDVLALVETHPFFANAPVVRIAKLGTSSSQKTDYGNIRSSTSTNIHWLRRGIALEVATRIDNIGGGLRTRANLRSIMVANGLVELGAISKSSANRRGFNSTAVDTTIRIGSLKGHIFPVKVGNRFSYRIVSKRVVRKTNTDSKYIFSKSCKVIKKYKAEIFHKKLSGYAYFAQCNYAHRYDSKNVDRGILGTFFFDELGYWITADPNDSRQKLTSGDKYTKLKSFSLSSSSKQVSRSVSFTSKGTWLVQIAAARSRKEALRRYARIKAKYPTLVTQAKPDIQRTNLGRKGIYYRVRLGALASKREAQKLCASFRKRGLRSCLVRRR